MSADSICDIISISMSIFISVLVNVYANIYANMAIFMLIFISIFVSGPTARELARMFPTPPSAENQGSTGSPMQGVEFTSDTVMSHDSLHGHRKLACISAVKEETTIQSAAAIALRKVLMWLYLIFPECMYKIPDRNFVYKQAHLCVYLWFSVLNDLIQVHCR